MIAVGGVPSFEECATGQANTKNARNDHVEDLECGGACRRGGARRDAKYPRAGSLGADAVRSKSSCRRVPAAAPIRWRASSRASSTKHSLMKQSMVVINKAGGAGGEGFLDVKSVARQSAQAGHHAVEPVHDAARDRHSVQLQGHHAGRDDGARRVRPVGQRREALQDRQGLRRRRQDGERHLQDGRHRLQAGRPDHHGRAREADRRQVHLHPAARRRRGRGAAGRQSRRLDRQQSDRGGRAVARRQAPAAVRVRLQEARLQRQDRRRSWPGTASRPASRRASTSSI